MNHLSHLKKAALVCLELLSTYTASGVTPEDHWQSVREKLDSTQGYVSVMHRGEYHENLLKSIKSSQFLNEDTIKPREIDGRDLLFQNYYDRNTVSSSTNGVPLYEIAMGNQDIREDLSEQSPIYAGGNTFGRHGGKTMTVNELRNLLKKFSYEYASALQAYQKTPSYSTALYLLSAGPRAADFFVSELKSSENAKVSHAIFALGLLADEATVYPLVKIGIENRAYRGNVYWALNLINSDFSQMGIFALILEEIADGFMVKVKPQGSYQQFSKQSSGIINFNTPEAVFNPNIYSENADRLSLKFVKYLLEQYVFHVKVLDIIPVNEQLRNAFVRSLGEYPLTAFNILYQKTPKIGKAAAYYINFHSGEIKDSAFGNYVNDKGKEVLIKYLKKHGYDSDYTDDDLRRFYKSTDDSVKSYAIEKISESNANDAFDLIYEALNKGSRDVKSHAIQSLKRKYNSNYLLSIVFDQLFIKSRNKNISRDEVELFSEILNEDIKKYMSHSTESERVSFIESLATEYSPYSLYYSLGSSSGLLETSMKLKGLAQDTIIQQYNYLKQSSNTEAKELHDKLIHLKHALSNAPNDEAIQDKTDAVESRISRLASDTLNTNQILNTKAQELQKYLKPSEALIDFIRFPSISSNSKEDIYAAIICKSDEIGLVEIGSSKTVDTLIQKYLYAIKNKSDLTEKFASELYSIVFHPIVQRMGSASSIYICPTSQLNLVSFSSLVLQDGFLIDYYNIYYISNPRDIISGSAKQNIGSAKNSLVYVFANPDFNAKQNRNIKIQSIDNNDLREMRGLNFAPLPGTKTEADYLSTLFENNKRYQGRFFTENNASKKNLLTIESPFILHIASHGFYLNHNNSSFSKNPMHRSGIALSGAQYSVNQIKSGHFDMSGIVTAEEISTLELDNTELVVLSACDTASGDIHEGEGVLGLRRGFAKAGAKSSLLTLWPISDDKTSDFMYYFYKEAIEGGDIPKAFSTVQRSYLRHFKEQLGTSQAIWLAGPFLLTIR